MKNTTLKNNSNQQFNTDNSSADSIVNDLQSLIDSGIITPSQLHQQAEMAKRNKYLAMHPYAITHLSDGRWMTHFKDEKKGG